MNRVLLDEPLSSKLNDLHGQAALCGPDGHVVGYYIPAEEYERRLYDWVEAQVSVEELERRSKEPGGKTTKEVLDYLQSL